MMGIDNFDRNRKGEYFKTCNRCRRRNKKYQRNGTKRCPHGRQKQDCVPCGGACEHGRRKSQCQACAGADMCEPHNIKRTGCRKCKVLQRIEELLNEYGDWVPMYAPPTKGGQCKRAGGANPLIHNPLNSPNSTLVAKLFSDWKHGLNLTFDIPGLMYLHT